MGLFFSDCDWDTDWVEGKLNVAMCRDILYENLIQSTRDLTLGRRVTFQKYNDTKHTAKATEWLRPNCVNEKGFQILDLTFY